MKAVFRTAQCTRNIDFTAENSLMKQLLPAVLLQLLIIIITCLICLCVCVCVCVCVQQVTLRRLLDHLKLVASYQEVNKMTCQNLAVCFGPVLLSQRQEASCHTNRVFIDSEELASALHFKKHIEVLHYLLQLWPGEGSFFKFVNKCQV